MELGLPVIPPWLAIAAAWFCVEIAIQAGMMRCTLFTPLGDETDYIQSGIAGRPFTGGRFHRVPLLPSLAWVTGRLPATEQWLRWASAVSSAIALGATGAAMSLWTAPIPATVVTALVALTPERIVLGNRIWPDAHLAAMAALIALFLSLAGTQGFSPWIAGAVGLCLAVMTMTRLDALVAIPATVAAWVGLGGIPFATTLTLLVVPAAAAFLAWWAVSRWVFDQTWPDSTWHFNLRLAQAEADLPHQRQSYTVDDLVHTLDVADGRIQRSDLDHDCSPAGEGEPRTGFIRALVRRGRTMLGPDAFVGGKIVPTWGPPPRWFFDGWVRWGLTVAVPLLVAAAAGALVASPSVSWLVTVPGLTLLVPAVLFHARTRFRLPAIPMLGLVMAVTSPWALPIGDVATPVVGLLVFVGSTLVLLRATGRKEA